MPKNLYMEKIGKNAKNASYELPEISIKKKNSVLKQYSTYLKNYSNLTRKAFRLSIHHQKLSASSYKS